MLGLQKKTTFMYFALLYRLYKDVTDTVNDERGVRLVLAVVKPRARSQLSWLERRLQTCVVLNFPSSNPDLFINSLSVHFFFVQSVRSLILSISSPHRLYAHGVWQNEVKSLANFNKKFLVQIRLFDISYRPQHSHYSPDHSTVNDPWDLPQIASTSKPNTE